MLDMISRVCLSKSDWLLIKGQKNDRFAPKFHFFLSIVFFLLGPDTNSSRSQYHFLYQLSPIGWVVSNSWHDRPNFIIDDQKLQSMLCNKNVFCLSLFRLAIFFSNENLKWSKRVATIVPLCDLRVFPKQEVTQVNRRSWVRILFFFFFVKENILQIATNKVNSMWELVSSEEYIHLYKQKEK